MHAPEPPRWLAPLAGGVPLAYYVAGAAAHAGLYEEGSFVAAARSLGIPHPPGAPLTSLLSALFALLPVGPLSFRVSAASALCVSLMLGLYARALFFTLLAVGARAVTRAALLSLAATWFLAQTPLVYAQATRPNVFALQFALALLVIDVLVRFELSEPTADRRKLYFGAFVQGLSFANHHVFALLMLAVAAPTLGRVFARRGFLGLMGHVAAPILGFSAWIYVPIRGGRAPFLSIGDPSNLTRALWVLSADPWWGPSDQPASSALARLATGLGAGNALLAAALFVLALLGCALASAAPSPRRFALLWLIALIVPFTSTALILEPKLTDDAYGALVPCALAVVALATVAVGMLSQRLPARLDRVLNTATLGLCAVALLALALLADARGRAHAEAADALDDLGRRSLPTRAALLTRDVGTWLHHLGAEAEEGLRADLTLVPLATLHYPGARESVLRSAPDLAPVLARFAQSGTLQPAELRDVARARPLALELDRELPFALFPALESTGLFDLVHATPFFDVQAEARERARFSGLYTRLGDEAEEPTLASRLTRVHFLKGVSSGVSGRRGLALLHTRLGLRVRPRDPALLRLQAALATNRPLSARQLLQSESEAP